MNGAAGDDLAEVGRGRAGAPAWRIGETLPWVIAWTGEAEFSARPSEIFVRLREVVQPEAPGLGAPMLRTMHLRRQRRGVVEHRRHVCGERTPVGDRYRFPAAAPAGPRT